MATEQNNKETPPLYTWYGKQYNFNDFLKLADEGFDNYISGIKGGNRQSHIDGLREAYANMMQGIKDGKITYENGRYIVDGLGYTNTKGNKSKDYYGIIANYLYKLQGTGDEYVAPSESTVETPVSDSSVVEETPIETPSETSTTTPTETPTVEEQTPLTFELYVISNYPVFHGLLRPDFDLNLKKPYGPGTTAQLTNSLSKASDSLLYSLLNKILDGKTHFGGSEIEKAIFPMYKNRNFISDLFAISTILNILKGRNQNLVLISKDSPSYYINGTYNKELGTIWIWDTKTNTLKHSRIHDIPSIMEKIKQNYLTSGLNDEEYIKSVTSHKEGGVLKAQEGTKLWYQKLLDAGDFDLSKYNTTYNTDKLYNPLIGNVKYENGLLTGGDAWGNTGAGKNTGRYIAQVNSNDVKTAEDSQYYKDFTADLLNEEGTDFSEMGKKWAEAVDKTLPQGNLSSFYDENGKLRESWEPQGNNTNGIAGKKFTKLGDYVNWLRNDLLGGNRHNIFYKGGKRYFYTDQDGKLHWVNPDSAGDYTSTLKNTSWDNGTLWEDYELTGLSPQDLNSGGSKSGNSNSGSNNTIINPTDVTKSSNGLQGSYFNEILPNALAFAQLMGTIRANNRNTKILMRGLKPVLKDTYERYSPVTGAFSLMNLLNSQGNEELYKAAQPFTSDARLSMGAMFDANKRKNELGQQAFLADDNEIKRTMQEALARVEDNMARRSLVANENRASLNLNRREIAELLATRTKQNWNAIDKFLQEQRTNIATKAKESKEMRDAFKSKVLELDINDKYTSATQVAKAKLQALSSTDGDITKNPDFQKINNFLAEMERWKQANLLGGTANLYGYKYNNKYLSTTPDILRKQYGL